MKSLNTQRKFGGEKGTSLTRLRTAIILPVIAAIRKKINQKKTRESYDDEMEKENVFHQSGA